MAFLAVCGLPKGLQIVLGIFKGEFLPLIAMGKKAASRTDKQKRLHPERNDFRYRKTAWQ